MTASKREDRHCLSSRFELLVQQNIFFLDDPVHGEALPSLDKFVDAIQDGPVQDCEIGDIVCWHPGPTMAAFTFRKSGA